MQQGYMKQRLKKLIRDAGINPADWIIRHEDDQYLHLKDFDGLGKVMIIDKASGTEVKRPELLTAASGQKKNNTVQL